MKKKDILYSKGRDMLTEELDIVKIIRKLRVCEIAIRHMLVPEKIEQVSKQAEKKPLK